VQSKVQVADILQLLLFGLRPCFSLHGLTETVHRFPVQRKRLFAVTCSIVNRCKIETTLSNAFIFFPQCLLPQLKRFLIALPCVIKGHLSPVGMAERHQAICYVRMILSLQLLTNCENISKQCYSLFVLSELTVNKRNSLQNAQSVSVTFTQQFLSDVI